MNIKTWRIGRLSVLAVAVFGLLGACGQNEPQATSPQVTTQEVSESAAETSKDAEISEIQEQPVWVKPLNQEKELSGEEGMGLQYGETIRTEDEALAEIDLKNGLAFRIGGDAVLTLKPGNELHLNSGEMITWVEEGKDVPVEIVTPGGIAGIRGTTVYVEYPDNPEDGILFFSWEGTIAITLPNQTEEIILTSGDEVRIKPGETDVEAIRDRVRHLKLEEWQQRRAENRLLNDFEKPLPTLEKIQEIDQRMLEASINKE
ncbi:MAG: FecR domain-containing protein [Spirulinaceae cyanobacterium]